MPSSRLAALTPDRWPRAVLRSGEQEGKGEGWGATRRAGPDAVQEEAQRSGAEGKKQRGSRTEREALGGGAWNRRSLVTLGLIQVAESRRKGRIAKSRMWCFCTFLVTELHEEIRTLCSQRAESAPLVGKGERKKWGRTPWCFIKNRLSVLSSPASLGAHVILCLNLTYTQNL